MRESPEELSLYEKALLSEMEAILGVGGGSLEERIRNLAAALGVGVPQGPIRYRIMELWYEYLGREER